MRSSEVATILVEHAATVRSRALRADMVAVAGALLVLDEIDDADRPEGVEETTERP